MNTASSHSAIYCPAQRDGQFLVLRRSLEPAVERRQRAGALRPAPAPGQVPAQGVASTRTPAPSRRAEAEDPPQAVKHRARGSAAGFLSFWHFSSFFPAPTTLESFQQKLLTLPSQEAALPKLGGATKKSILETRISRYSSLQENVDEAGGLGGCFAGAAQLCAHWRPPSPGHPPLSALSPSSCPQRPAAASTAACPGAAGALKLHLIFC